MVRERRTTYSEVATQLIAKMKMQGGLPDSEMLSVNSYSCSEMEEHSSKKKSPTGKPSSQEDRLKVDDKKEKNIKRRVYDALNVQLAAGVLQKRDKKIMPNTEN